MFFTPTDRLSSCLGRLSARRRAADTEPPDFAEKLQYPQRDGRDAFKRRIKKRKPATELELLMYGQENVYGGISEDVMKRLRTLARREGAALISKLRCYWNVR